MQPKKELYPPLPWSGWLFYKRPATYRERLASYIVRLLRYALPNP